MLATCLTHGNEDVDVVVKLNGAMDLGARSAAFELIGSLIATRLGIDCPRSYLVWLSSELMQAVSAYEPSRSVQLSNSVGWNFGSEMLKDAIIWAKAAPIAASMQTEALAIFSFDGLIQNVDRQANNPNLLVRGDRLTVIDHECAFSFLTAIIRSSKPWNMGHGDYMERHALAHALRGEKLDWRGCMNAISCLTGEFFDSVNDALPPEWNAVQDLAIIKQHITTVLDHTEAFEVELQRRIA